MSLSKSSLFDIFNLANDFTIFLKLVKSAETVTRTKMHFAITSETDKDKLMKIE